MRTRRLRWGTLWLILACAAWGQSVAVSPATRYAGGSTLNPVGWAQRNPECAFDGSRTVALWEDQRSGVFETWWTTLETPATSQRLGPYRAKVGCASGQCLVVWDTGNGLNGRFLTTSGPGAPFPIGTQGAQRVVGGVDWDGSNFVILSFGSGTLLHRLSQDGGTQEAAGLALPQVTSTDASLRCIFGTCLVAFIPLGSTQVGLYRLQGASLSASSFSTSLPPRAVTVGRSDSDFMVAWQAGSPPEDIAVAPVSGSGVAGGVITFTLAGAQVSPRVAFSSGTWLVTWLQNAQVWGTRLSATGMALDPGGVSLTPGSSTSASTRCLVEQASGFRMLEVPSDVRQVTVSTTLAMGTPTPVARAFSHQVSPAVAAAGTGAWLEWGEQRNDLNDDLRLQRIQSDGSAGPLHNLETGTERESNPDLACGPSTCLSVFNGVGTHAARRFDAVTGTGVDPNPIALGGGCRPAVTFTGNLWAVACGSAFDITMRRVLQNGVVVDTPAVTLSTTSWSYFNAVSVAAGHGRLALGWPLLEDVNNDYAVQVVTDDLATPLATPFNLARTSSLAPPALVATPSGFLGTVQDSSSLELFRLDTQGALLTPMFSTIGPATNESSHDSAFDGTYVLATWARGARPRGVDVVGALVDTNGLAVGSVFPIAAATEDEQNPVVTAVEPGRFLVAYEILDESPGMATRRVETRWVAVQPGGPGTGCSRAIDCASFVCQDGVCLDFDGGVPDAGVDAGVDAGTDDAGSSDAGDADAGTTDAGIADAGSTDAGNPDAGASDAGADDGGTEETRAPLHYTLGCGCSQPTGTAWWLLVVVTWRLTRRRATR